MATTETWVLDGLTISSGNYAILELTNDPPAGRPDWVTAADSEDAVLFRQPFYENRKIAMKMRVTPQASMDTALDRVGAIVDKIRKASETSDGIALTWTPANSTRTITYDVVDGSVTEMPIATSGEGYSWWLKQPIFTVEFTAKPYGRGAEVTSSTTTASSPIVEKEIASVPGDVPALGRLIVTDNATQSRRHLEWGMENLYYNPGTSLTVDSDSMVVTGFSGTQVTTANTPVYDPNAAGTNVVRSTLFLRPTAVVGTGNLSHVGSFRVKAHLFSSGTATQVRFAWSSGDGPVTKNNWASLPVDNAFCEVDLGLIHISPVLSGTQRWTGWLEAIEAATGFLVEIDYLLLIPVEGYAKSRAVYTPSLGAMAAFEGFEATTAGGALNGKVAPLGGTWATVGGDADDFTFADLNPPSWPDSREVAQRSVFSDTAPGRHATLGTTTYTNVLVQASVAAGIDPFVTPMGGQFQLGVIARWTDISNYHGAWLRWNHALQRWDLYMATTVAGSVVASKTAVLSTVTGGPTRINAGGIFRWYRLTMAVYASGFAYAQIEDGSGANPGAVYASVRYSASQLATGGSRASGKVGIADQHAGTTPVIRGYSGVYVFTPDAEPVVVYSGRQFQARWDGAIRQDSTGTYTGQPPSYNGNRFLLPPGTSRVAVKARRQDVDVVADDNIADSTSVQVAYTPRYLVVPL